jgi:AcrR family transcriptional regulator
MAAVQGQEEALISALRGCVDRRGERAPRAAIVAIVAAVLHCARTTLIDASAEESVPIVDELVSWATDVIEDREEFLCPSSPPSQPRNSDPAPESRRSGVLSHDEKDMIESAILRLARSEGFRGLDCKKVGSMSGLPAARFRRHFATLADGYLAAIRRTSASFFIELTAAADPQATVRPSIRAALDRACRRAASDPVAARLTFRQVIEPGVAGLTCREALISELAVACADKGAAENPSMRVRAEARVAALWESLAQAAQS